MRVRPYFMGLKIADLNHLDDEYMNAILPSGRDRTCGGDVVRELLLGGELSYSTMRCLLLLLFYLFRISVAVYDWSCIDPIVKSLWDWEWYRVRKPQWIFPIIPYNIPIFPSKFPSFLIELQP